LGGSACSTSGMALMIILEIERRKIRLEAGLRGLITGAGEGQTDTHSILDSDPSGIGTG
jgi:hypothetical protein